MREEEGGEGEGGVGMMIVVRGGGGGGDTSEGVKGGGGGRGWLPQGREFCWLGESPKVVPRQRLGREGGREGEMEERREGDKERMCC